ncbi:hypothetical protein EIP86_007243 [Pleurotus ostreatoroseus]|nr:hypothetical protein EIP86_007243 [Pleurotus ostreatoroseus]
MATHAVGITNVNTPSATFIRDMDSDIDLTDDELVLSDQRSSKNGRAKRRFCRTNAQARLMLGYTHVGIVVETAPSSHESKLDEKFIETTTLPLALVCATFTTATPLPQDVQALEHTLTGVHLGAESEPSRKTYGHKHPDTAGWYTATFNKKLDDTEWDLTDETSSVPYKFELVVRVNCVSFRRWTPVLQAAVKFNTTAVDPSSADEPPSSVDFDTVHCENWGLAHFNSEGRAIRCKGALSLLPVTPGIVGSTWKSRLGRDGRTEWVSCLEVQIPAEEFNGRESTQFCMSAELDCECLGSCVKVSAEPAMVRMDRHEGKILFREMC